MHCRLVATWRYCSPLPTLSNHDSAGSEDTTVVSLATFSLNPATYPATITGVVGEFCSVLETERIYRSAVAAFSGQRAISCVLPRFQSAHRRSGSQELYIITKRYDQRCKVALIQISILYTSDTVSQLCSITTGRIYSNRSQTI